MDTSKTKKLPPKEAKPLQPLSPERVNNIRRPPVSPKISQNTESLLKEMEKPSPQSSPVRRANLFADYNPNARPDAQQSSFALPQSPSLPDVYAFRSHVRTNSDVQGLVKRFEHLDVRDRDAEYVERKKRHEAELRRAQIAREEAESDVKRLREEVRKLKKDGDEARERERKVVKRLEVVTEEYAGSKEANTSQIAAYEKETRKARKEAFKSSSAVVKLQEELKGTRSTLRVTQSNLEMEKLKNQQRDQEAFNAQYKLVALQEELDRLKLHASAVEQEKEVLKASLKEEEVARIAAEGMIALPAPSSDDDLATSPQKRSPRKRPVSPLSDDKENAGIVTKKLMETKRLEDEIQRERVLREQAEAMLEFLQMECKFRCCFCRVPDTSAHDNVLALSMELNETMKSIRRDMQNTFGQRETVADFDEEDVDKTIRPIAASEQRIDSVVERPISPMPDIEMPSQNLCSHQSADVNVDESVTMGDTTPEDQLEREQEERNEDPDAGGKLEMQTRPTGVPDVEMQDEAVLVEESDTMSIPIQPVSPGTPPGPRRGVPPRQRPSIRTITTTTTIPMQFTPIKPPPQVLEDAANASAVETESRSEDIAAPVIDREAALAAIAYRRGRAKSIANGHATPRKQMIEGLSITQRRDISAPTLGQKPAPVAMNKGSASVGRAGGRLA